MSTRYIGDKEIQRIQDEIPVSGPELIEVQYVDGKTEVFSKIMFDEIVSEEKCDATTLRDKRVRPVVAHVLGVMRIWGIKTGEVGYFSALLNQSLMNNENEALKQLWKGVTSNLNTLDDVSLVDVDKVLKSIVAEPIPSPYGKDATK